ncbi:MAG TPA: 2'-5' RNA ligase family protein [Pyrinomonadaceae bacterium]
MHGVVSLLDDEHYALVEKIWDELERDFGVRGIYVTPFPHLSYQVAEGYDIDSVEAVLRETASESLPFKISTAGLGIFNVTHPVLYIPIVRSPALSALHEKLWLRIPRVADSTATRHYQPEMWVPHITLAHGDLDYAQLSAIVLAFSERQFHWEINVNNLSMIYDTGTEQGLRCRFNFNGDGAHQTKPCAQATKED